MDSTSASVDVSKAQRDLTQAQTTQTVTNAQASVTSADDAIWTFDSQHGGDAVLGEPISREFTLYGHPVQILQQAALEVNAAGSVEFMHLSTPGLLPYMSSKGLTLPGADPPVALVAPSLNQANYSTRLVEFVRATVPENWNGRPVQFLSAVTADGLDVWGVSTSTPAADPHNPNFIYQRFQNGVLLFDASSGTTTSLPFVEYLKDVLTAHNLPSDLTAEAASSPLFAQYDPSQPLGLSRPAALADTDLTEAFTPDVE
jgi:hypothetical protein